MQITVKPQDLFKYSTIPLLTTIILIAITILIIIIINHKPKGKNKIEIKEPINKHNVKNKYLNQINALIDKINNKNISNRKAYQELSLIIRHFIFEMTNIKVQNYTLSDIKQLKLEPLTQLVEEYYDPEFSYHSTGNILDSINKTREVIIKWQ